MLSITICPNPSMNMSTELDELDVWATLEKRLLSLIREYTAFLIKVAFKGKLCISLSSLGVIETLYHLKKALDCCYNQGYEVVFGKAISHKIHQKCPFF